MFALLAPLPARATSPTDEIRGFFADANKILTRAEDREPDDVLNAILALARPMVAFPEAAELALGSGWGSRTPAERDEFVRLFADLLERAFVLRLAGAARARSGVDIRYRDEFVAGDLASVQATVLGKDGNDIPLEFRMLKRGPGWAVLDVAIHGVSIVMNYHAQFTRIVRDASYVELVARLRDKTAPTPSPTPVVASRAVLAAATDTGAPITDTVTVASDVVAPALASNDRSSTGQSREPLRPIEAAVTEEPVAQKNAAQQNGAPAAKKRDETVTPAPAPRARDTAVAPAPGPRTREEIAASVPTPSPVARPLTQERPAPPVQVGMAKPDRSVKPDRPIEKIALTASRYWVQVGAFKDVEAASRVAARLLAADLPIGIAPDASLTRVRVGPFPDRSAAASTLRALELRGYRPFIAEER